MATKSSASQAASNDDEVARLKARVQELEEQLGQHNGAASISTPIVVDLGKTRRKRIKALKRGKGKLVDEVREVIDMVQTDLGSEAGGRVLVPVVVLYRRRRRKRKRNRLMFPF